VSSRTLVNRETFAPLGAPAFEDDAPILGAHADEEAVRAATTAAIRLKRSLHFGTPDRAAAPWRITNRSEASKRVSNPTVCGRFASLPRPDPGGQSFPHLWKNLWKSEVFEGAVVQVLACE
jgi:hypothetical protein